MIPLLILLLVVWALVDAFIILWAGRIQRKNEQQDELHREWARSHKQI